MLSGEVGKIRRDEATMPRHDDFSEPIITNYPTSTYNIDILRQWHIILFIIQSTNYLWRKWGFDENATNKKYSGIFMDKRV